MQTERDKQGLLNCVKVGKPSFIMPHISISWWCIGEETLTALLQPSRLKAGCGQYCPPHGAP
jgi:hypothetical protein